MIRISKKKCYNDYFNDHSNNTKLVWKGIKQIIYMKNPNSNSISTKLIHDGQEITGTKEIANAFSSFFSNVGDRLATDIPHASKSPLDYIDTCNSESFYLFPTTPSEIEREISYLNTSKTVGPNSIPIKVLKLLQHVLSKPLEILFNASFATGIVPQSFKIARIIPVFKKGDYRSLNNYRPISLLSIFNKLLEKLMYTRLINFLEQKCTLYNKQFGFRSQYSTEHAILTITDTIQNAIENRNYSCGIFLDFSKAFDTVHHGILINKLEKYGIRGVAKDWFVSYLTDRQHYVSVNNTV